MAPYIFRLAEVSETEHLPKESPVVADVRTTERGKLYRTLICHPWSWETAIAIASAASPHPEKMNQFAVKADWDLATGEPGFDFPRLRPMHQSGLGESWSYVTTHLPSLFKNLDDDRSLFASELIAPTPLSRDEVLKQFLGRFSIDQYIHSAQKKVRLRLLGACMNQQEFAQTMPQNSGNCRRRHKNLMAAAEPQRLLQLAGKNSTLFEQCMFDTVVSRDLSPFGEGYLPTVWAQRIEAGQFTKKKGKVTAVYNRNHDDTERIVFTKSQEQLSHATLAYLEWKTTEGERTWNPDKQNQECPQALEQALRHSINMDIAQGEKFANPLAGLMYVGAQAPDIVQQWPRTMSLPRSNIRQSMSTSQAPALVHVFRQQLLQSAFIERLEQHIDCV